MYKKAVPFAVSELEKATISRGIGEAHHRLGDYDNALPHFDNALRELGYQRAHFLPRVLLETAYFYCANEFRWWLPWIRSSKANERASQAVDVCHNIAETFLQMGDVPRYTHVVARRLSAAITSRGLESLTQSFALIGLNYSASTLNFPARLMLGRAQKLAKQCNDANITNIVCARSTTGCSQRDRRRWRE